MSLVKLHRSAPIVRPGSPLAVVQMRCRVRLQKIHKHYGVHQLMSKITKLNLPEAPVADMVNIPPGEEKIKLFSSLIMSG